MKIFWFVVFLLNVGFVLLNSSIMISNYRNDKRTPDIVILNLIANGLSAILYLLLY